MEKQNYPTEVECLEPSIRPLESEAPLPEAGSNIPKSAAEKKLVRKIDLHILPCMWMMYLWSYMDRTK